MIYPWESGRSKSKSLLGHLLSQVSQVKMGCRRGCSQPEALDLRPQNLREVWTVAAGGIKAEDMERLGDGSLAMIYLPLPPAPAV